MKRLVFFLLIAVMTMSASAYEFMVDGLCYNRHSDGNSVYVTWQNSSSPRYTSLSGDVNIPSSVTYNGKSYPVTEIAASAFSGCSGLTSVTIGNSVTSIGNSAFSGCSGMTSVTIGNSVTEIGSYAFKGCSGLKSVTIPNSVTSIVNYAFSGCSGLTSVVWNAKNCADFSGNAAPYAPFKNLTGIKTFTFGNEVEKIPAFLCDGLSGLTSVTIGNSVRSIGNYAFKGCSGLTSVTIPNSVRSIGNYAFSGCSGLTSVEIPNSVTSIGNSAFYGTAWYNNQPDGLVYAGKVAYKYKGTMPSNTSIAIKEGTVSISPYCFQNCSGLTSITIPNSVTTIGSYAFSGCSGLTSLTIGNSVTSIGQSAFSGCSGLTSVVWNAKNCADFSVSGYAPFRETRIKTFTFGNEVEKIPAYLCYKLSGLTSVTIGNSVTSIGSYAFEGCSNIQNLAWNAKNCISNGNMPTSNITTVTIGDGVEILPNNFVKNSKITSINIPNSVKTISDYAFQGCSGLTSVAIPNSVTEIGLDAFAGCTGFTKVDIFDLASYCKININGAFSGPLWLAHHLFLNGTEIKDLTIPSSVSSIGSSVFSGCSELTSVTIPNSVTDIGKNAFYGCSNMKSVSFGNSVLTIGSEAFRYCSGLAKVEITDITSWCGISFLNAYANPLSYAKHLYINGNEIKDLVIPNTVLSIRFAAFYGCSGLTSVTIPNSVSSIGKSAFYECNGLTSLSIGNSVTSFAAYAFGDCSGLKTVNWNAKNCPDFASADETPFNGLTEINTFNFGNEVERIPANLCNGLSKITAMSFGNAVNSIGTSAFEGCRGLTELELPNSIISIGQKAFYNCRGLLSITFPNSVTNIGEQAFANCTDLDNIYSYPNPANVALGDDVFYEVPKYTCVLHVIPDYFEAYKKASQWKTFFNIIDDLAGVEGVEVDAATKEVEGYYDLKGIRLEEPIRGQVNIVRYKDGTSQKIVN